MATIKNIHDYSDIINLPYKNLKNINICLKRSCSTVCSFAALTGHKQLIQESPKANRR